MKRLFYIAAALVVFSGAAVHAETSTTTAPSPVVEKRFWRATGEMIVIGYSPWIWSHYVMDYEYADISMDTVRTNFKEGFVYDTDGFQTNQWGHPFQGSLYYNAARENGFNFWEATPFVLAGDFGWEFFMEAERPSYNDMVNTFLGGVGRGEMTYRLSRMVRDNRATGWTKFWKELGAGIINPVGFLDRAAFGDMWKNYENPADRNPQRFFMVVDGGYQRGRRNSLHPDEGYMMLDLRYNDMHDIPIEKPFDYFDFGGNLSFAYGSPPIPFLNYRGLLAAWEVTDDPDVHHMVAPGLSYNYFNNGASAFGGQGMDIALMSRWKLKNEFEIRTEAGGQGYIFAGIQTDYTNDSLAVTGRNYDFGTGGGPLVDFRLRRRDVDWIHASYFAGWFPTNNGISTESRIMTANIETRYPIYRDLYAGLGWAFQERRTLYDHLPSTTRTNSIFRFFMTWAFRVF